MSLSIANKVFTAAKAIEATRAAERAAYYATAKYQPSDFLEYVGYTWQVVRVGEYGSGDLLYVLERVDLPDSRLTVSAALIR